MQMNVRSARNLIEKALAFAHAALDDTTPQRAAEAFMYAHRVLPEVVKTKPRAVGLGEARHLFELVGQLRAALAILDRKLEFQLLRGVN